MPGPFSERAGTMKPLPVPSTGNPELEYWLNEEITRLWHMIQTGDVQIVSLEPLTAQPSVQRDGMVGYFVGNVAGVGVPEGVYAFELGAWKKL